MEDNESIVVINDVSVNYGIRYLDDFSQQFDVNPEAYKTASDWSRDSSCRHVPWNGDQLVSFLIVQYQKHMTTLEVMKDFGERGIRPAVFQELVAFVTTHPEFQEEYWIVALGTSCKVLETRVYTTAYRIKGDLAADDQANRHDSERSLSFFTDTEYEFWPPEQYFLAVRELH